MNRRQPGIASPCTVAPVAFKMVKERADESAVEIVQRQCGWSFPQFLPGIVKKQPEGVAIGCNRIGAGVALCDESVGKEGL